MRDESTDQETFMNNGLDNLGQAKSTLIDLAIRFGPKLLAAMLILTVGAFVAGWVARAPPPGLHRVDLQPPARQLFMRVARILVVRMVFLFAAPHVGGEVFPLIAGLGVSGGGLP